MKQISRWIMMFIVIAGFYCQNVNAQTVSANLTPEEQLLVLQKRVQESQPVTVDKLNDFAVQFGSACKSFLTTFDEGTTITIDRLNQFMGTNAGKITIFFIAWKLMSQDVISISTGLGQTILGILLLIPYFFFVKMIYRNFITGKRVLVQKDGRVKTYEWQNPVTNSLIGESYAGWSVITVMILIAYTIILVVLIF
jgi:hypothetical protein